MFTAVVFIALGGESGSTGDGPIARDVTASTTAGTPVAINVLTADADPDGFPIAIIAVNPPSGGTVSLNSDGTIEYTPDSGTTSDYFTYSLGDGAAITGNATVFVTISASSGSGSNSTPDTIAVKQSPVYVDAANDEFDGMDLSADGIDSVGLPLTVVMVSAPSHGQLVDDGNSYAYYCTSAAPDGIDGFSYQLTDGTATSALITVSILYYTSSADPLDPTIINFAGAGNAVFGASNAPASNSTQQGSLNDCWFVAAAAGLGNSRPNDIADMIATNANGTFTVTFPGETPVTISNFVGDANAYSTTTDGVDWLKILEKAYGQCIYNGRTLPLFGPYSYINTPGFPSTGISILTGSSCRVNLLAFTSDASTALNLGGAFIAASKVVTALSVTGGSYRGLVSYHVYTVLQYDTENDRVQLRNPWGSNPNYTVSAGDGSEIGGGGATTGNLGTNGVFWMSLSDFTDSFNRVAYER